MTGTTTAPGADAVRRAAAVVELGLKACTAYGREDLGVRLAAVRRGLDDPGIHIVVAGEFKKGKSSLVNALVGAQVCPVDDDVATAVPTHVRYGREPSAELIWAQEPVRREAVPLDDVRRHVIVDPEPGGAGPAPRLPTGAEIRLPCSLLSGGLVLVDTPGVGGLGSAQAAASLAAVSVADAVVFVTDASQELTRAEVDFLRQARELCGTVVCVLTKTDFYLSWRRVRDLDEQHLVREVGPVPVIPVSSSLRMRAARLDDPELDAESGFGALVDFLFRRVADGGVLRVAADAASEVVAVAGQLTAQLEAERAALSDPEAGAELVSRLTACTSRAEELRAALAKWQQTLGDGIADLSANVDHDLRDRIRQVISEAGEAVDRADPADTWPQIEAWLTTRVAREVLANYTLLRHQAGELSEAVARHFRDASDVVLDDLRVHDPATLVGRVKVGDDLDIERHGPVTQAWSMMRQSYGGILMFTVLPSVLLGPLGIVVPVGFHLVGAGVGLAMGRKGFTDEKKRHLASRRAEVKNTVRKYCDEVSFAVGKDSRDTVRRVQRQLRDFYATRAEELRRSGAEALRAAQQAAEQGEAERQARIRDLAAELDRLAELRERALAVRVLAVRA